MCLALCASYGQGGAVVRRLVSGGAGETVMQRDVRALRF